MHAGEAVLAFTFAAGLLTLTPGLDTALVLRTAAVEGPRRGMMAAFGICMGVFVWGLAASLGLGAVLAASRLAYNTLRIAGAIYVLWLGGGMIVAALRGGPADGPAVPARTESSPFARGLLCNLLNPKVGVFYVSFLPLFVPAGANVVRFSLMLAAIHAAEGLLWFWILTGLTHRLSEFVQRTIVRRWLDGIAGTAIAGCGAALLLEQR